MSWAGEEPKPADRLVWKALHAEPLQVCEHRAGKEGKLEKRLVGQVHFDPVHCHPPTLPG